MEFNDLSTILMADSILTDDREGSQLIIKRAEPLGFIGKDYQRFYVHFISITRNPNKPFEYLAFGKTKVKERICSFQGSIIVKQAQIEKSKDIPAYEQGWANCDLILFEDKKQEEAGLIKGTLKVRFLLDSKGRFRYDGVMFESDNFSNNQFIGIWTSYKNKSSKICNWGDYRIPSSGDLDIGAGEFSVNQKYVRNGWLGYALDQRVPNGAVVEHNTNKAIYKMWWE